MGITKNILVLLLAAAQLAASQDLGTLPDCGTSCISSMEAQFATLGCTDATDTACLCGKPDFQAGIDDCAAQSCVAPASSDPAGDAAQVKVYANNLCLAATAAATTSEAPATTSPDPVTTTAAQPEVTSDPVTTGQPLTTTEKPSSASQGPTETSNASSAGSPTSSGSAAPAATSQAKSADSTKSSTSTGASGASSATASSTPSSTATSENSESGSKSGLSVGAIAGISAGVAVVFLAVVILALVRCYRARANKKKSVEYMTQLRISEPMPGAGPFYADGFGRPQQPRTPHAGVNELEMSSRRYEDMVPRIAPKLVR